MISYNYEFMTEGSRTFFDGLNRDWVVSGQREAITFLIALHNHLSLRLLLMLCAVCLAHIHGITICTLYIFSLVRSRLLVLM